MHTLLHGIERQLVKDVPLPGDWVITTADFIGVLGMFVMCASFTATMTGLLASVATGALFVGGLTVALVWLLTRLVLLPAFGTIKDDYEMH